MKYKRASITLSTLVCLCIIDLSASNNSIKCSDVANITSANAPQRTCTCRSTDDKYVEGEGFKNNANIACECVCRAEYTDCLSATDTYKCTTTNGWGDPISSLAPPCSIVPESNVTYTISNERESGMVLSILGGLTVFRAECNLATYTGCDYQLWTFSKKPDRNAYTVSSYLSTSGYMMLNNNGDDDSQTVRLRIASYSNRNREIALLPASDGHCRMMFLNSSYDMSLGASAEAPLQVDPYTSGNTGQHWKFTKTEPPTTCSTPPTVTGPHTITYAPELCVNATTSIMSTGKAVVVCDAGHVLSTDTSTNTIEVTCGTGGTWDASVNCEATTTTSTTTTTPTTTTSTTTTTPTTTTSTTTTTPTTTTSTTTTTPTTTTSTTTTTPTTTTSTTTTTPTTTTSTTTTTPTTTTSTTTTTPTTTTSTTTTTPTTTTSTTTATTTTTITDATELTSTTAEIDVVDEDVNPACWSSPCADKGNCAELTSGFNCSCIPAFTGASCEIAMTACKEVLSDSEQMQRKAMMASQTMSSTSLLIVLGVLIVIFIVLLDFSTPRLYHMIQEISLLVAHAVILPARTETLFDSGALCDPVADPTYDPPSLSPMTCSLVAVFLHYTFLVHFTALFCEALHNYTYYTFVYNKKFILNRLFVLVVCLLAPILIVLPSALLFFADYSGDGTCWLNVTKIPFYIELFPILILAAVTIIVSESTGMREFPTHKANDHQYRSS